MRVSGVGALFDNAHKIVCFSIMFGFALVGYTKTMNGYFFHFFQFATFFLSHLIL